MRPIGPNVLAFDADPVVVPLEIYGAGYPQITVLVDETNMGDMTYTVEYTSQSPFEEGFDPAACGALPLSPTAVTAPAGNAYEYAGGSVVAAIIITPTAGTGGSITWRLTQAGPIVS